MIYDQIRARLLTDPTIKTKVGQRIYRLRAPQGTQRPFIRLAQISREAYQAFDGDSGTHRARYQIDVFSDAPDEVSALAAAVRSKLSGWSSNSLGSALILELDSIEEQPGGAAIYRVQQDFEIIGDFDAAE